MVTIENPQLTRLNEAFCHHIAAGLVEIDRQLTLVAAP